MIMSKKEREELSALSKEVFGTKTKWLKYIQSGQPVTLTVHKVGKKGRFSRTAKTVWHTVDTIREYMFDLKERKRKLLEEMKTSAKDT